jgi:cytochrome c oxidase subunit II
VGRGPGIADTSTRFGDLFTVYQWLMIAITAAVFALVLFTLIRYRRRGDEHPRGKDKRTITESLYALLLTGVAVTLVTLTFRTEDKVDRVAAQPGLRVDVVAFQWQWRFGYPQFGKTVIGTNARVPTLVVPVRTVIEFDGISRDVIHSFWIPAARFKRDEFPKRRTRFDLTFDRVGTYLGRCAEFCGLHHADMSFVVKVVPRDEFERWVKS